MAGVAADFALAHRAALVAADRGFVDRHARRRSRAGIEEAPGERRLRRARREGRPAGLGTFERHHQYFGGFARFGSERSEEHTSELQSLMRISYAVFCLQKKNKTTHHIVREASEKDHVSTHYYFSV